MTADEIRAVNYADVEDKKPDDWARSSGWDKGAIPFFLREIAAQLADQNFRLARTQEKLERIASALEGLERRH